jgi:putative ABC transport system permease protein
MLGTMQSFLRNLRFAFRMMAKSPGFTAAILFTLALGIGANAAIFTVANAVLLRPFPYRDPSQIVSIHAKDQAKDFGTTLLRYETVRDRSRSFEGVAVWANDSLNLTGDGEPLQVPIARVSPNFFSLLGVQPQLGRSFTADEGTPQGKPVVMLSNSLWQTRYHGDPSIVGRTVNLDSVASEVVGVLPANVQFPFVGPADVWTPRYFEYSLMSPERLRQGVGYLDMIARMRPGVPADAANSELAVLNRQYREQNPTAPDAAPGVEMTAQSLRDLVAGNVRGKVVMLMAMVGVLLLIACANVASLLLSRAMARKREAAVRTALGASRGSIMAQLLTESVLLALLSGFLGTALAWAAARAFVLWGAAQLPEGIPVTLDARVLLFTFAVSIGAALLFGVFPALQMSRVDVNSALREEGRGASTGRVRSRLNDALVVGQVALSLMLLIGTGLLVRSFVRLLRVDPGFQARNILTMNVSLSTLKYAKPDRQIAFFDDLLHRVAAIPGVRSAAISAALPLSWKRITPVLPQGQPEVPLAQRPFVDIEAISPDWFQTMHVPLRAGRAFNPGDTAQAPPVIVVNETFARQYWPGINAVGKHVVIGRRPVPAEVVGVAADIKNKGLEQDTQPQLYLPFPQLPWGDMNLLVRTDVPAQTVTSSVRAEIAAIDPDQPVTKIETVEELLDDARTQPRFLLLLVSAFSITALVLAIVGIYGVLSYSVSQRQQEFGIRMAMGAERRDILRLVVRHGFRLALAGIAAGLIAAFALTHLIASMLYKTGGHDPLTFMAAPAIFLAISLLASYLPARRATQVSPIEILR